MQKRVVNEYEVGYCFLSCVVFVDLGSSVRLRVG